MLSPLRIQEKTVWSYRWRGWVEITPSDYKKQFIDEQKKTRESKPLNVNSTTKNISLLMPKTFQLFSQGKMPKKKFQRLKLSLMHD